MTSGLIGRTVTLGHSRLVGSLLTDDYGVGPGTVPGFLTASSKAITYLGLGNAEQADLLRHPVDLDSGSPCDLIAADAPDSSDPWQAHFLRVLLSVGWRT